MYIVWKLFDKFNEVLIPNYNGVIKPLIFDINNKNTYTLHRKIHKPFLPKDRMIIKDNFLNFCFCFSFSVLGRYQFV